MPRRVRYCACLLLAVTTACWAADERAQTLLREMYDATRELDYDGIFVYQRGAQLDTMRLVHMRHEGAVHERLISLSGPAREVIRDGSRVTCLFADNAAALHEKGAPLDLLNIGFTAPIETLLANYRFSIDGQDRVANRTAHIVGVMPHRDDRYGYRLWVDEATKLLLKSMILGRGDRVLEQMEFTQIALLDGARPELLEPEIAGAGFTWLLESNHDSGDDSGPGVGWEVGWVPHGFELKETHTQPMATSRMPVGQLVYSDGLAMVTVFIEQLMVDEAPLQGYSARGAVNAFSRVADEFQITVVGELPLPTVRQIAASVVRTD